MPVGKEHEALFASIAELRRTVDKRRLALRDADVKLKDAVAEATSAEPLKFTWYEHDGPLPRSAVKEAAGLTDLQLAKLMQDYKVRHAPKAKRRR